VNPHRQEQAVFVVLLTFSTNKAQAAEHMEGHRAWIRRGVDDGTFVLVGSIRPGLGGAVLASGTSADALRARVAEDPFVVHDVVRAEIVEIDPNHTDPRLAFLAEPAAA
jgi:uncharacterized protein YciI